MKSTAKGAVALAVMALSLFCLPAAWGQLRTHSGAFKKAGGIQHPKDMERRIFQLTNEARRKHGLPALEPDDTLTATARKHSDDMLKREYFSHTSPDGKTIVDRLKDEKPAVVKTMGRAGENIFGSSKLDYSDVKTAARSIVDGWMISPGHRANILNPGYTHLGVGVSILGTECRATQNFGQKMKFPLGEP
jgi:uncharacterized protein YkwD